MKKLYSGKTKDLYQGEDDLLVLKFKDDVTGVDGKFDPGANQVGLSIEGVGRHNVMMTSYFFELLNSKGIPTHYVASNIEENTLTVKPANVFGQGIEVITRYRAVGSFIRRYGAYIEEGTPLDAYMEITLKDDDRQDPLITREGIIALGIMTEAQYDELMLLNLKAAELIKEELAKRGLELYDIKLEYGFLSDSDRIVLIDEVSGGNMRVYRDGQYIEPMDFPVFTNTESEGHDE